MWWQDVGQKISEALFSLVFFLQGVLQFMGIVALPCSEPLQYTLGSIDPRFNISETEIKSALADAENLWESASGKNLFEYSTTNGLPVNFMYDERQERTQAGQKLEENLATLDVEGSEAEVKNGVKNYQALRASYDTEKRSYETALNKYNSDVQKANKEQSISESDRQKLQDEYDALGEQYRSLEILRAKVNNSVQNTNNQIVQNQQVVQKYNDQVKTFQELYGGEGEAFDQGLYTGKDISIYQYDNRNRLVLVLAHEMGHALGIEHTEDPKGLMYYLMKDQNIENIALAQSDVTALGTVCEKRSLWR